MLAEEIIISEAAIWGRSGQKVVRKFRCMGGNRHGRIVSKPAQCFAPINIKARATMKRTRARLGARMMRKAKKTKRINPASRRIQMMNKAKKK